MKTGRYTVTGELIYGSHRYKPGDIADLTMSQVRFFETAYPGLFVEYVEPEPVKKKKSED